MSEAGKGPAPIDAVPLRHPWRWVAAGALIVLLGLFLYGAATNDAYRWSTFWRYLFDDRIPSAIWYTLQLTVFSMVLAVVLGVTLAVMRLSPNPVFRSVAWVYLWIFRGTPVYVQLVFWGLFPTIYQNIQLGVPFGPTFFHLDLQSLSIPFLLAIIGLGLNEAAYMAEIIRAGISSVPEGQIEVRATEYAPWHPGRCAELLVDGSVVGHAGELHPAVVAALELPRRTSAMELDLDALPAAPVAPAPMVSGFPPALIDVALVVDESVPAQAVQQALTEGAGELLESVRLFDVYASEQLGAGRKSLAYKLAFRAPDRTLTVEEAVAARDAAVARAAERFGATLRGA